MSRGGGALRRRIRIRAAASGARVDVTIGPDLHAARPLRVLVARDSRTRVQVGAGVGLGAGASLVLSGGSLAIGDGSEVGDGALLETAGGRIVLGRGVRLGAGCVIRARGSLVELGDGVSIDERVVVHGGPEGPIRVGDRAVVGMKAVLTAGADVAADAAVDPHAVVGR